ncbi:phosphomevalonate kinase [Nocardia blacklockiae]|uniref:phosphomevalonate kinase n=1 Tax=Nocardia blacklockiae TaxID=480036 RepID=UPI001892E723|nr:phosphomevalonate kinase [Nocardia blacklockiae]MBF6176595.1 phosphomevalonate kinase [Nocardia blacklockiae]
MIRRVAPGKLFLAGEYAVLQPGHPAVVVAVDRCVTVTVTETLCAETTFTSDLGSGTQLRCVRRDGDLTPETGHTPENFRYVLAAANIVERLVAEAGGQPTPFAATTTGAELTDGAGHKLGLGSSAAITVATVSALADRYRLRLGRGERYRLAMLATVGVDPGASGGDVAAATWGGWIAYRSPDRGRVAELAATGGVAEAMRADWPGLSVRPLPPPHRLGLLVGWTGKPASSSALTRRAGPGYASIRAHPRFLAETTACVERMVTALDADDVIGVQHEIRRARELLDDLDDMAALGIRTPELDTLCAAADLAGAAAKSSGAGGGDCGIAVVDRTRPEQATAIIDRWAAAGIRHIPLGVYRHPDSSRPHPS